MSDEQVSGKRQRLVVFLDGTWNNKDDCTNVTNLYNLVTEGEVAKGFKQVRKYDEGVGTGVLDSISGGVFGNGLEINVREAYDWLVANFNDEGLGGDYQADEIFIFGFSRGAYTARSLAGFIARCGLLRRGAPLTVGQLWEGYGELERTKNEENETVLDRLLNKGRFRQLEELIGDPWLGGELRAEPCNDTEFLLVQWSRRVKIQFIGVYDTVGAIGLDALAIPGLRSKGGRLHNMRPSSLFLNFRHALGIDEYRSSFQHTPLVEFRSHDQQPEPRTGLVQRWFVGAHSNVGGGYADNGLAQRPLEWMLEEAMAAGLVSDKPQARTFTTTGFPVRRPDPRDSYAEFAWPVGTYLLRTKRNYRQIAPPDEARAKSGVVDKKPLQDPPGFSLSSNELVDESVWDYAAENTSYAPANLVEFAARMPAGNPEAAKQVAGRAVLHDWPPRLAGGYVWLGLWSILAGLGMMVVDGLFQLFPGEMGKWDWRVAGVVAMLAILVDWGESRLKLKLAAGQGSPFRRAMADAIFWTRSIFVIFFVAGVLGVLGFSLAMGWNLGEGARRDALWKAVEVGQDGWLLPTLAALALLVLSLLDFLLGPIRKGVLPPSSGRSRWRVLGAGAGWLGGALGVVAALILLGHSAWHIVNQAAGPMARDLASLEPRPEPTGAVFAGHFLFLLVALAYLFKSWSWVGEPMGRANLGSMGALMWHWRGSSVQALLERWQRLLLCRWGEKPEENAAMARDAVRAAVKNGLWRDFAGLTPVYNIVLGYGLYFAAKDLGVECLDQPLPWWWLLPAITWMADWIETGIHLTYLGKTGPFPRIGNGKVRIAWAATLVKFIGFAVSVGLSVGALGWAAWKILVEKDFDGGWRGALAGTILLAELAFIGWLLVKAGPRRVIGVVGGWSGCLFLAYCAGLSWAIFANCDRISVFLKAVVGGFGN